MLRIRCAGGFITPTQLEGVASIALQYGVGDMHITSRRAALAKDAQNDRQKEKLLRELVFYASRSLLITRGIDVKKQEEVYVSFFEYFIDTELIDKSFRGIITIAQRNDSKEILAKQSEALELSEAV